MDKNVCLLRQCSPGLFSTLIIVPGVVLNVALLKYVLTYVLRT